MKLPSLQFYTGDWLKDPGVRSLSYAARGLWIDMLSLMHECDRRGYLQLNGSPVNAALLARMTGGATGEVTRLLRELDNSGVFSCTDDGILYNRRMVRDERKRQLCGEAGKRGGGNPAFIGQSKGDNKGPPKQKPKPSSSITFSPSGESPLPPLGKGAEKPKTKRQMREEAKALEKAHWKPTHFCDRCGWSGQGFELARRCVAKDGTFFSGFDESIPQTNCPKCFEEIPEDRRAAR